MINIWNDINILKSLGTLINGKSKQHVRSHRWYKQKVEKLKKSKGNTRVKDAATEMNISFNGHS